MIDPSQLILLAVALWLLALLAALSGGMPRLSRGLLVSGILSGLAATLLALPAGITALVLPPAFGDGAAVHLILTPSALWLLLFGLIPAALACTLGSPAARGSGWQAGAALSLLGALGVFALQHVTAWLIAWELMSLGGALMILSECLGGAKTGRPVLFMLALLEIGTIALLAALLWLSHASGNLDFDAIPTTAAGLSHGIRLAIGCLLLAGFGAKLGLLPYYEWFPPAYGSGSGASGVLFSGVVLNAAFFGLSRALTHWLPADFALGAVVIMIGVVSAILAILYAFQEEDWRELLSLSSAENAALAVTALGAALLFKNEGHITLAALAWVTSLLHLAGHSLAKGALFLAADGVYRATGSYHIGQQGLLRNSPWWLGVGAIFAAMSLAAMPPQAGFVSEWYLFQTVFQGFHLHTLGGRLVLALTGAGLALTVAVAFATFTKVVGLGLQGDGGGSHKRISYPTAVACSLLGFAVLELAAGMPVWFSGLSQAVITNFHVAGGVRDLRDGWLLVPLTAKFAFISPGKLLVVGPLLALLPLSLLWLALRRIPPRHAAVWYGGLPREGKRVATTALTFSNALRTFYSFIYRPTLDVEHEHHSIEYFLQRLTFNHRVAPIFGPLLFRPLTDGVLRLAGWLRVFQSGSLNFYLAILGIVLIVTLLSVLF